MDSWRGETQNKNKMEIEIGETIKKEGDIVKVNLQKDVNGVIKLFINGKYAVALDPNKKFYYIFPKDFEAAGFTKNL